MSIGERLRLIRNKMSQEEFSKLVGVYKGTVANYEKGVRTPDADYLNTILQHVTDINPVWLLTGEGSMRCDKSTETDAENIPRHIPLPKDTIDPLKAAFMEDWGKLSGGGQMRVWATLKDELKKEMEANS